MAVLLHKKNKTFVRNIYMCFLYLSLYYGPSLRIMFLIKIVTYLKYETTLIRN
jgi:hypothetical protein